MKKTTIITGLVTLCILIYGLFAFALWSFNPGEWVFAARVLCALLMGLMVYIAIAIITSNENK